MKRLKQKLKSTRGLTLGEMLCAVLIVLLVSGTMASTVSLAVRQYQRSLRESEAEVLCSTLATIITDELAFTTEIKVAGGQVVQFQSQHYAMKDTKGTFLTDAVDGGYGHLLLGTAEKSANLLGKGSYPNGLLAKVESLSYDNGTHCFTVKLSVGYGETEYASRTFHVINANQITSTT